MGTGGSKLEGAWSVNLPLYFADTRTLHSQPRFAVENEPWHRLLGPKNEGEKHSSMYNTVQINT